MHPRQRTADLVIEQIDGETLVYDLRTNDAHCLDPAAAALWDCMNGERDVATLAGDTALEPVAVSATIEQLRSLDLLENASSSTAMTRRDGLRTALRTAAAVAVAAPVIRTIAAPEAAHAGSLGAAGAACTSGVQCASGACVGNVCTAP